MSTITAQNLVDRCASDLKDTGNATWTAAELLVYLNDAQRAIVRKRPDAKMTNTAMVLVAGTKQSIPTHGDALVDVTRNMGTDGSTVGQAIHETDMSAMDKADRNWHTDTASATVDFWMRSDDPKVFYVSPPQPSSSFGYVELFYSVAPADILIGANIDLEDTYANAIYYYMMARAHAKEDPKADNALIAGFMNMFNGELS